MKRNFIAAAAAAALLAAFTVSLSGCGAAQHSAQPVPPQSGTPQSSGQDATSQTITQVAPLNALMGYALSAQGVYEVQPVRPASVNLMYLDVQTKQELYLCSVPNCGHNTDTCTSYIPLRDGEYDPQLFFHNDALYLTRGPVNNESAPSITRIEKDGSGRRLLLELDVGESYYSAVFGYGDSVLMPISKVEPNGARSMWLEKINLQTGAREKCIEYPQSQSGASEYSVMGMVDTRLIFMRRSSAGQRYFWVNPSDTLLSLEECCEQNALTEEYSEESVFYTIQNEYLCKFDRVNQQLSYKNMITNEAKAFDVPALEDGDTLYGLELLYEDKFALTLDDKNGTVISALLDTQTGNLTGVRIPHRKEQPNAIIGVFGDDIICKTGYAEVLLRDQGEQGLMGEIGYFTKYSYVNREAFWRGEQGAEIALPE